MTASSLPSIPVHAGVAAPSDWVVRFASQLPAPASALDLACGSGRHTRWLAARGIAVTAVDRDASVLAGLREIATVLEADLEGAPWPLPGQRFDLVVVTHYLWRALLPQIVASVAPGGLLIYETFALGHERHGRPRNPDFLLRPGELLEAVRGELEVVAYEHGECVAPPRCVQRMAASRPSVDGQARATPPARIVG
jgi:SAM-dependent methyltransferase